MAAGLQPGRIRKSLLLFAAPGRIGILQGGQVYVMLASVWRNDFLSGIKYMRCLSLVLLMILSAASGAAGERADGLAGLTLRAALARGLAENLELRVTAAETPLSAERTTIAEAVFDARLEVEAETSAERTPTASVFTRDRYDRLREYTGWAALSKG